MTVGRILNAVRFSARHGGNEERGERVAGGPYQLERSDRTGWQLLLEALPVMGYALLPTVVISLLVWIFFDRGLLGFTPSWSDEIDYWREVQTFRSVGFAGGYYTVGEIPAPAGFTHFGPHGPVFPALVGSMSLVTGWGRAAGPIFNLVVLTAAVSRYLWILRASKARTILAVGSLISFWPILLYIPSAMQESLQQALAIALGASFTELLTERSPSRNGYLAGGALLLLAAVLRPTWAPMFMAYVLFPSNAWTCRRLLAAAGVAVLAGATAFAFNAWVSSPFPNFMSDLTATAAEGGADAAMSAFWKHLGENAVALLRGDAIERGLRLQVGLLIVVAVFSVIRSAQQGRHERGSPDRVSIFHLLNLAPVGLIVLALYDTHGWRDSRVIAPHLLLSILVSIGTARLRFVLPAIVLNALLLVGFVGTFQAFHKSHYRREAPSSEMLARAVRYEAGADPWCNTVLVDLANYTSELLDLPPGIGISVIFNRIPKPVKSRYVLVEDNTLYRMGNPQLLEAGNPGRLMYLGATAHGKLFLHRP